MVVGAETAPDDNSEEREREREREGDGEGKSMASKFSCYMVYYMPFKINT